jgi:uncharacterized protein
LSIYLILLSKDQRLSDRMTEPTIFDHLLAVISGIIFPLMTLISKMMNDMSEEEAPEPIALSTQQKLTLYKKNNLIQWAGAGLVVGVWLYNGRTLGSLGFQLPDLTPGRILTGLVLTFVLAYIYDLYRQTFTVESRTDLKNEWDDGIPILPATKKEFKGFLLVALTAGVCEEIFYRGFLINYLAYYFEPTGQGLWMAVAVPSVIFGLSHLYQGWEAVVKIILLSLVFGSLFVVSGSLLIPIILHVLVDVVSGYAAYRMLKDGATG